MATAKRAAVPFGRQTVLFHWMLEQLEASSWEKLPLDELKVAESEVWLTTPGPFAEALKHRLFPLQRVPNADIDRLDARIFAVTAQVNERRGADTVRWKYFQYLGLLFTELYLERYFTDREALRTSLNAFLARFNVERGLDLQPYGFDDETGADDLSKLAFWQATGSGKTLLLHANFFQYKAALERHGQAVPTNVLLLTPNAGLGRQHVREMEFSGLRGGMFEKGPQLGLAFRKPDIHVIEITKFRAKPGPDTINPAVFEGNNLVFVDEGHRGSSKVDGEWRRFRQELSAQGFCFEYSATFAQAAMKDADIRREYAKSVVIDYAYKRFHGDGYGKHWRILNIRPDSASRAKLREQANTRAYLTGALTVLFQQLLVHAESRPLTVSHNLSKPLCIFVGASVTGTPETSDEQTDVMKVIEFLASFVHPRQRDENERLLNALLASQLGFQTKAGQDVFHPMTVFPELKAHGYSGTTLYDAILKHVFNAPAPALLHAQELKEAQGEMSLAVGENPPFAVINVGDVAGIRKLCEKKEYAGLVDVQEKSFKGSLFDAIETADSPLTVLIGSRKFTEGWSSWRVSVMGLLNLGKSPGTQIIQLFGRGVRLQGKDRSLKRSSSRLGLAEPGSETSRLRILETLSVFGIRADYMDQFEEELRADGADTEESTEQDPVYLPIVKMDPVPRLRVIRPPAVSYVASSERPVLEIDAKIGRVFVDAYPRVQFREDPNATRSDLLDSRPSTHPTRVPGFAFVDHRRLYADLIKLKNLKGWTNLALPRSVLTDDGRMVPLTQHLLAQEGWYEVRAPDRLLEVTSLKHLELWQQLASELLATYADAFYRQRKGRYETEHSRVVWLHELPETEREKYFPKDNKYEILVDPEEGNHAKGLIDWIEVLAKKIQKRQFDDVYPPGDQHGILHASGSAQHLYNPLLHSPDRNKQTLRVVTRPTALNVGEYRFVCDLQEWLSRSPALLDGVEVFLLRNESKTGTGFFDIGGFYPDFMLWIVRGNEQWLTFVDPKGLGRISDLQGWSKVQLWKTLKEIEERNPGLSVHLDSWLVSVTERDQSPIGFENPATAFTNHVVLQRIDSSYIERLFVGILGGKK
jgi:hypothetical protein